MKKLQKISAGVLGLLLSFGITVNPVAALTKFEFDDWNTLDGYYGTKDKVDDVVTKLVGQDNTPAFAGQLVGAFTKASEGALLKDGITEELYIELDPAKYMQGDIFEATVSLNATAKADEQLTEKAVTTTMTGENEFTITSNGWSSKTFATVTESGIYTYRWHYFLNGDVAYINFSLLHGDEVIGTSGDVKVEEVTAENKDTVSVRSVWFCNIKTRDGVYVHSRLPQTTVDVDEDSTVTVVDDSVSSVFKDSLVNLEEFEDIGDTDVAVKLEANEKTDVTEGTKTSFEKVAGNGKIAEYLDIEVLVTAGTQSYNLHELVKPVSLTVAVPLNIPAVAEGYTRTYYVLREHNGVVEKLSTKLSEDGKNLTFATDKFSTYALAYEDVKEVDNPLTADAIVMYVAVGVISLGALALGVKVLKKNN